MDPNRYVWLDLVRGLSAFAVMANHVRWTVFVPLAATAGAGPGWHTFYFATSLGHEAVLVFFVLSGFFVGGSVDRAGDRFDGASYFVARLARLWVVLLPALCATALVSWWVFAQVPDLLHRPAVRAWGLLPEAAAYGASATDFIGNVFFLQGIAVPTFGLNGPLWSLANEFWYYVIFPLAWFALARPRGGWWRGALALGLLVAVRPVAPGFLIWLMGFGVYVLHLRIRRPPRGMLTALALLAFGAALGLARSPWRTEETGWISDLLVGAAFAVLCLLLATLTPPRSHTVRMAANRSAAVSYSLYAWHFPFLIAIGALVLEGRRFEPGWSGAAVWAAVCLVLLSIATVAWYLFERRTGEVRDWVRVRCLEKTDLSHPP